MSGSVRIHEQLISLQSLWLDGHALDFAQAFLTIGAREGTPVWSCTVRGLPPEELGRLEGELHLRARALDGRTIEGRVSAPSSAPVTAETPAAVELSGLGALLIEGRELSGG